MRPLFITLLLSLLLSSAAVLPVAEAARPKSPSLRSETLPGPLQAEVLSVLDGDTIAVRVHVWIGQELETHVRIAGIDTPEIHGKCDDEREKAAAARAEVQKLLQSGTAILSDIRLEKYAGRVMAHVTTQGGTALGDYLVAKGFARRYGGEKRQGWCG